MIQFNSPGGVILGQGSSARVNGLPDAAPLHSHQATNSEAGSTPAADDSVNLNSSIRSKYDTPEQVLQHFDPEAVIDNVASVLEQAIKRAAASGASAEELGKMTAEAQRGVDKGFGEAQDIIKGLGLMSDELTTRIDSARSGIHERLGELTGQLTGNAATGVSGTASAATFRLGQSQQNDFSFNVKTAEGDVVTISAAQQQNRQVGILERQGENARELFVQWQDSRGESFHLSVEGDLNEQELSAIENLLGKVDKVADQFFNGQYESAFEKAKRLGLNDDALVSMSLNMTQKSVAVAEYSAMATEESRPSSSRNDWIQPIKRYAQALGDLQRSQSGLLGSKAWLDMLSAHPAQKSSMVDFAQAMMRRMSA